MSTIRITGFRGEIPKTSVRLLPEGAAQTAENVIIESGSLKPAAAPLDGLDANLDISTPSGALMSSVRSLFKYDSGWFFFGGADTDYAFISAGLDADRRVIAMENRPTGNTFPPIITSESILRNSGTYPPVSFFNPYRYLKIPSPGSAPTAAIWETAVSTTAVATDTSVEVDDIAEIQIGDVVRIVLDTGDDHVTTVDSITVTPTVNTMGIADAMPSQATAGNVVKLGPTVTSDVPETRYYTCTFVDEWGAEGPPGAVSNQVEWREGQVVKLTGLPTSPAASNNEYNLQAIRIYRVNTTASGISQYQFVGQLSIGGSNAITISSISLESPYALVTTTSQHNFSRGDEVCFSNFGTTSAGGITAPVSVGRFETYPISSVGYDFLTVQFGSDPTISVGGASGTAILGETPPDYVSPVNQFDLYHISGLPSGTSANTSYEDTEYRLAQLKILRNQRDAFAESGIPLTSYIETATSLRTVLVERDLLPAITNITKNEFSDYSFTESLGDFGVINLRYTVSRFTLTFASAHGVTLDDFVVFGDDFEGPTSNDGWTKFAGLALKPTDDVNGSTDRLEFTVYTYITEEDDLTMASGTPLGGTMGLAVRGTGIVNFDSNNNPTGTLKRSIEDITASTAPRVTLRNHGLVDGDQVTLQIDAGQDTNFTGVLDGNTYYVDRINANEFDLHLTAALTTAPDTSIAPGTAWSTAAGDGGSGFTADTGMPEINGECHIVTERASDTSFYISANTSSGYSATGASGGVAAELTGNEYSDTRATAELGEVLSTVNYDPPDDELRGIVSHPAGFFVAFFKNTIAVSEPGAPHAWPLEYQLQTQYPIVGLGVFANNVLVTTRGSPYLITGNTPSSLIMTELEVEHACVAKRGIVDMGMAIAYPSPDGLIVVAPGTMPVNVTEALFTRKQWRALNPESFVGFYWEGYYCAFYNDGATPTPVKRCIMINARDPSEGVRYIDQYGVAVHKSLDDDVIYYVDPDENYIQVWQGAATNESYEWKSAPYFTAKPVNMAAAKVFYEGTVGTLTIEVLADEVSVYGPQAVSSTAAFRLPGGFRAERWEVILRGDTEVTEVVLATTMEEMAQVV